MSQINGKWLEDNSIPDAKLQTISAADLVHGSAIQLSSEGAIGNNNGLFIKVGDNTLKISDGNLQVGKITSANISGTIPISGVIESGNFLKADGSVVATSTLRFSNARISGVLSGIDNSHVVNYEQLQNAITNISGTGADAGLGLTQSGTFLNVGAGNGIYVNSTEVGINSGGVTNDMLSGNIPLDKITSGADIVLKDGSIPFTSTIKGVSPVDSSDLATRKFVEDNSVSQAYVDTNFATSSDISDFATSADFKLIKDASPKLSANLNANSKEIRNLSSLAINTSTPGQAFQINDSSSTDVVVLTSTGRFGLGTNNPALKGEIIENKPNVGAALIGNQSISGSGLTVSLNNNTSSTGFILDLLAGGASKARFKPNGELDLNGNLKVEGVISSSSPTNYIRFYHNGLGDLPNAGTNNGLFAYVQSTNNAYFAAGTSWNRLLQSSDLNDYLTSAEIDTKYATKGDLNNYVTSNDISANYVTSTELDNLNIEGLNNVVVTGATSGQSLKYNGANWVNSTDTGSGTSRKVDNVVITNIMSTNMQLTLVGTPIVSGEVCLDIIGGVPQKFGDDFTVSGNLIIWDSSNANVAVGMESDIVSGDELRITYAI